MTKNFKELISEYKIIIPLIQRDYAQGREDEKTKANNFLEAILKGTKNGLNLDFIYGKIETDENGCKNFIPLDGQQRLTTLLLIYWFVSLEDEYLQDLQKFNYEVRSSTKDFIKKLMSETSWNSFKTTNIKSSIENANWFFLSWKNDPTVVAILNMLDLIEQKFTNIQIDDLDNITFEFLNLNDFDLTDELYVKMNARGKPLTEFENFKSNFEKFLVFEDKEYEHKTKAKLDNEWLNIFWKIAQKKVNDITDAPKLADEMFYNFFYNVTLNFYLEQGQVKIDSEQDIKIFIFEKDKFKEVKEDKNLNNLIKDKLYVLKSKKELYIFKTIDDFINNISIFDFYKYVYINPDNVNRLISILDTLKISDRFEVFISDKDISYWERAKFYALSLGYINKLDDIEFEKWKRVTFNIINNQLIQSPENLINTLKSLKKLSSIYQDNKMIYKHIKESKDSIEFFHEIQRDEESIKANLILDNESWESELTKAENNWYLNGQIGYLLKYSQNKSDYDLEIFKEYRDKFIALWNFVNNDRNNQILLYQALLTKGDYLPRLNSNHTFCSFDGTSVRIKNDNWRKVFNDEIKTKYFKNLLDGINESNIKDSLEDICKQWLEGKSYCSLETLQDKYLYTLVSDKENIKYCKQLQLRYYQEGKEIYLLQTKQMNGTHSELYTYNLYKKSFKDKIFKPFQKSEYFYTNSWELPCIVLNDWLHKEYKFKINIYFDSESEKYEIYFIESNEKLITKEILDILEKDNFKKEKEYQYILKTDYTLCKENELVSFIKYLTKKLNNDPL